jgi:fructuronate reductase
MTRDVQERIEDFISHHRLRDYLLDQGFEQGKPIDVRDPLSARLRTIADQAGLVAERLAPALLDVREIFGSDLAADPRFRAAVTNALARIITKGAKEAVADLKA